MSEIILETEDLTKEFAGFVAVNGVSLRVERGTIHALIGPNGAGKTTCFNLLTKFLQPTRGRIVYKGAGHHRAWRRPTWRGSAWCARSRSRRCSRISACWRTCASRCRGSAAARSISGAARECSTSSTSARWQLIADVGLSDVAHVTAVELPYGRKRALEIATTLALDPEMLLLDEPTAGMGHEDIDRIAKLIKTVAADRTVLMVEHNLSVVENLCQRITVLTRGRVLAEGDYETVSNNPEVREAYMGVGHA